MKELLEKYNIDKKDTEMIDWLKSIENQPKDYTNLLLAIATLLSVIVIILTIKSIF